MTDPVATRFKLDQLSDELGTLSAHLAKVETELAPIEEEYTKFVDDYELGLYQKSVDQDDFKLPAEALRLKLANRSMPPELYGQYVALTNKRRRIEKRMSQAGKQVDAQRSILSALKAEMDGSR